MTFVSNFPEPLYKIMQSRKNYKITSRVDNISRTQHNLDLTSKRKRLYGKIDTDSDPVVLLPDLLLKEFPNSDVTGLGFMVDACSNFINEYNQKIQFNPDLVISGLGSLSVIKRLPTYEDLALQRRRIVANFLVSYYLQLHTKKISNFEDFTKIFMRWAKESAADEPITNSGIIVSHSIPHSATGLVVELGNYEENDDSLRGNIVTDENFHIYSNTAAKHGFYISRNSPWRLIANIESSRLQQYVDAYVVETYAGLPDFFSDFYIKAHKLDLRDFRSFMIATYNAFVHFSPVLKIQKICSDGTLQTFNQFRFKTSLQKIDEKYDLSWWAKMLYDLRCQETQMPVKSESQKMVIHEKIETIFRTKGAQAGLDYIQKTIKESI